MDNIMEIVKKVVDAVKGDKSLLAKLTADPVKTIESVTGLDLPDEAVEKVMAGVKDQLGDLGSLAQSATGILSGAAADATQAATTAASEAAQKAEEAAGGIGGVLGKGLDAIKKLF